MAFSNSFLVNYTKISPNKTSPRKSKIDTITIHCMAGNLTVESCGNVFATTTRKASSNYGVGTDGRIGLYVEEKDRSWATSNPTNDHRAITIEVANDGGASTGWHVSDKAMASLILLIADICKRNNIKKLVWSTNKSDRVNHSNGCNMTVHRDYAAKACPGDYLYGKHGYIADEVNKMLGTTTVKKSVYLQADFVMDVCKILGTSNATTSLSKTVTISKTVNRNHSLVIPIQKYLNAMGYNCGVADGFAGNKFDIALKNYQSSWMKSPDGEATAKGKTWKKLLGLE